MRRAVCSDKCGIYTITNMVNGKVYVGKSINIFKRWNDEKKGLMNSHLKSAVRMYGIDGFQFEVLLLCAEKNLNFFEMRSIKEFKSNDREFGYNKTHGGDGVVPNEETRKKMSDAKKGKAPWNKRKKLTEEQRKNAYTIPKGNKLRLGVRHSDETKAKLSAVLTGRAVWNKGKKIL